VSGLRNVMCKGCWSELLTGLAKIRGGVCLGGSVQVRQGIWMLKGASGQADHERDVITQVTEFTCVAGQAFGCKPRG